MGCDGLVHGLDDETIPTRMAFAMLDAWAAVKAREVARSMAKRIVLGAACRRLWVAGVRAGAPAGVPACCPGA